MKTIDRDEWEQRYRDTQENIRFFAGKEWGGTGAALLDQYAKNLTHQMGEKGSIPIGDWMIIANMPGLLPYLLRRLLDLVRVGRHPIE